jgi:hypothetical protein
VIVTLDAVEFWRLRALGADAERIALAAKHTIAQAYQARDRFVAELAGKYGFDPALPTFTLHDETCTLDTGDPHGG